jgi:hypothetical protein
MVSKTSEVASMKILRQALMNDPGIGLSLAVVPRPSNALTYREKKNVF